MSRSRDFLVILDSDESKETSDLLQSRFRITDVASERVLVVAGDRATDIAELADVPGVSTVTEGSVPDSILATLEESEVLFIEAWAYKKGELKRKERPGEGLDWDAPGYETPDPD